MKKQVNLTEEDGGKGQGQSSKTKIGIVIILIIFISILHYATGYQAVYYHALYRDLYFIPLILSGLWFGLRGAIVASLSVTFIYLPYAIASWHVSSVSDFERVLSVILFNIIAAILGLTSDRERAMEIAIRKSEHLSAIGQAVSGVAHDIKTPLVAIGGFIRLARKALKGNDPVRDKLNIAIAETERLENMVNEMLDFSRPLTLNPIRADFERLVREVIAILADDAAKRNIAIDLKLTKNLPEITLDPDRVKQALINLVSNALEVSPEGDSVTLMVSSKAGAVVCDIIDQGPGIAPEHEQKIFSPFFTTKKGGTGLGLAIAQKIIEAHDGPYNGSNRY